MSVSQMVVNKSRPAGRAAAQGATWGNAALVLGAISTLLYVVSAVVAFAASYDQGSGRDKLSFTLLGLLLPLILPVVVRRRPETVMGMLGAGLAFACALIGAAALVIEGIDRGAAVGSVAVLLPIAGCGVLWAMARNNRGLLYVLVPCLLVSAASVVLSDERSAMLGLACGLVLAGGVLWRLRLAEPSPWLHVIDVSMITLLLIASGIYLGLILAPETMGRVGLVLPAYYAQRFALWRDTPAVIQDYLFTGSGLGAAPMVLSTYLFLIHVPFYYHVHNLFLQVGIEQGLPGMIGLTGMFAAAVWSTVIAIRRAHAYLALCSALVLAALLALFVSGLFESDVYASVWVVGMFLPFGFAWLIGLHDQSLQNGPRREPATVHTRDVLVGMLPAVAVVALIAWPGADAQWLANRGALEQTRAELTRFRYPLNNIQDEVRRNPATDLDPALQFYRSALQRNPENVTALRRIGQIELSRGDYTGAQQDLETAYLLAPGQRATRQMLGEVYAVQGDLDRATTLWRTVDNGANELGARLWWYTYIKDSSAAERISEVLARLPVGSDQ